MAPTPTPKQVARFVGKLDTVSSDQGCWLWTGCLHEQGYGRLTWLGKTQKAHRVAYELFCGPIPEETHILHRCDTPQCCNPDHLYIGSHTDNMRDRKLRQRGNHPRGDAHYNAKLTTDDVRDIRAAHASGTPQVTLAQRYNVTPQAIYGVIHRKSWNHE